MLDGTSDAAGGALTPADLDIRVSCATLRGDIVNTTRCWYYVPVEADVGRHMMVVEVYDDSAVLIGKCSVPVSIERDSERPLTVAVLGDSIAADGAWIDYVDGILPNLTWVGTLDTSPGGNAHDGHNGYSWLNLVSQYDGLPSGGAADSPLLSEAGGDIDVAHWIGNLGAVPDVYVMAYGVNRVFTTIDGTHEAVTDEELGYAQDVIDAMAAAYSSARCLFALPTPGASVEAVFEAQYPAPTYNELLRDQFRWRRQHRREIVKMHRTFTPQVPIAATSTCLDPIHGYPSDDGIHPTVEIGKAQMAECFAASIVCHFRAGHKRYRR